MIMWCVFIDSYMAITHFRKTNTMTTAAMATSDMPTPIYPMTSKARVCCGGS